MPLSELSTSIDGTVETAIMSQLRPNSVHRNFINIFLIMIDVNINAVTHPLSGNAGIYPQDGAPNGVSIAETVRNHAEIPLLESHGNFIA